MFLDTNPLATLKLPGEMDEVPAHVSINAAELEPANLGESPCRSQEETKKAVTSFYTTNVIAIINFISLWPYGLDIYKLTIILGQFILLQNMYE